MNDNTIVLDRTTHLKIARGVRLCVSEMIQEGKTPYSFFINEDDYWQYVATLKSKIITYLPIDYFGFKHKHRDIYLHYADKITLRKIIETGELKIDMSNEENSVGKAVYTYPLKSGMFYIGNGMGKILMFEAEAEHCHITQTNDSPYGIGEADFFSDVKVINPRIITVEEAERLSRNEFQWKKAKKKYYGLDVPENASYDSFTKIIEHYNDNYLPM